MDSNGLITFRNYIIDSTKITGLVVVHKGEIIFKYGDIVENSYIASCRKSVLAMLYGKYVEDKTIDLDKTIEELGIDDVDELLAQEKKATVQEIISAKSGCKKFSLFDFNAPFDFSLQLFFTFGNKP